MLTHAVLLSTAARLLRRDDDDDDPNCVKAVPGEHGNVPITACNSYYNYDPQFGPAVAVAVIFGLFTVAHLAEGVVYKKRYTWVLTMGALWETIAFAIHAAGSLDQQQIAYATVWNVLFLLAPLWINAFAYMTFARMVHFYLPGGKVGGLRAGVIARWFVWADVVSFIVQAAGGVMTSPSSSPEVVKIGLDIYLGGMGLQQACILVFVGLMYAFQRRCRMEGVSGEGKRGWKPLLWALYGVLVCITIRIIFRIAEFAGGVTPSNPVPFHEQYTYALDCFPMMLALLILAVWHPGRFLVGPESEFPRVSRREKKERKRQAKEMAREEKEARRQAKREAKEGRRDVGSSGDDVV